MKTASLVLLGFAALTLAGCGGQKHAQAISHTCPGAPAKLARVPPLPPRLPVTKQTTLTAVQTAKGGATAVQGFVPSSLGAARTAYRSVLAGYRITSDARHTGDEELGFAGPSGRGQVKLVQACANRTTVAITFRGV